MTFEDLCQRFNASKSSIRRDLIELERTSVLRRVHGGAISLQTRDESLISNGSLSVVIMKKSGSGRALLQLVKDGQTIILGGGSSVAEVAHKRSDRLIQIVTNSIPVVQVFWDSRQAEVTLTGGYLYPRLGCRSPHLRADAGQCLRRHPDHTFRSIIILATSGQRPV